MNDTQRDFAKHRYCKVCGQSPYTTDSYVIVRGAHTYCERANVAIRKIGKKQAIAKPATKATSKTTAKKVVIVKPRRKLPTNAVTIECEISSWDIPLPAPAAG